MSQAEFATFINSSKPTVERWESGKKPITGPVTMLVDILTRHSGYPEALEVPEKKYPLRLWYMHDSFVCTLIDVDIINRRISIRNYRESLLYRAFGINENPTYDDYEAFLESRCFPPTRDKMKLMLKELDIPFYDPFMIIEKTEGRMAEDRFWIRIER